MAGASVEFDVGPLIRAIEQASAEMQKKAGEIVARASAATAAAWKGLIPIGPRGTKSQAQERAASAGHRARHQEARSGLSGARRGAACASVGGRHHLAVSQADAARASGRMPAARKLVASCAGPAPADARGARGGDPDEGSRMSDELPPIVQGGLPSTRRGSDAARDGAGRDPFRPGAARDRIALRPDHAAGAGRNRAGVQADGVCGRRRCACLPATKARARKRRKRSRIGSICCCRISRWMPARCGTG